MWGAIEPNFGNFLNRVKNTGEVHPYATTAAANIILGDDHVTVPKVDKGRAVSRAREIAKSAIIDQLKREPEERLSREAMFRKVIYGLVSRDYVWMTERAHQADGSFVCKFILGNEEPKFYAASRLFIEELKKGWDEESLADISADFRWKLGKTFKGMLEFVIAKHNTLHLLKDHS